MSFFDNLGKKASETTAKAVQKAQELAEISRINSLISDEEKKLIQPIIKLGSCMSLCMEATVKLILQVWLVQSSKASKKSMSIEDKFKI